MSSTVLPSIVVLRELTCLGCSSARRPMALEISPVPIILLNLFVSLSSVLFNFFDNLDQRALTLLIKFLISALFLLPIIRDIVFRMELSFDSYVFAVTRCDKAIAAIMLTLLRLVAFTKGCMSKVSWLTKSYPTLFLPRKKKRASSVQLCYF